MKNLIIAVFVLITWTSFPQQNRSQRCEHKKEMKQKENTLSPEQQAKLSSKKMTLHLDLNQAQQKKVYAVQLEHATLRNTRFQTKKNKVELNDEERFNLKTERLDNQITMRNEMKSILTEKQYESWQNRGHFRTNERQRKHNRQNACAKKG